MIIFLYLLAGVIAGLIAGMLGLGGGVVIVPILFGLFVAQSMPAEMIMHLAVATSLTTIVFTSISSAMTHHRLGNVGVRTFLLFTPGIIAGALFGAAIADHLPTAVLRTGFGFFELFVALQIGFGLKPASKRVLPQPPGMIVSGGVIGMLSSMVGIGGGTLIVPFLLWCNVKMKEAVGTSAACGFPIALAGMIGFIFAGLNAENLPEWSLGYVYLPAALGIIATSILMAPVGARLAHRLPVMTLKRIFAILLAIIGLKMIIS